MNATTIEAGLIELPLLMSPAAEVPTAFDSPSPGTIDEGWPDWLVGLEYEGPDGVPARIPRVGVEDLWLTEDGQPRQRMHKSVFLERVGATQGDLDLFHTLFVPRKKPFAVQARLGGPWKTVDHAIRENHIVRHLAGGRSVGVRAWESTRYACFDVDRHGCAIEEFLRRVEEVEACLRRLKIDPERCLRYPSPNGGRHIYVFFDRGIVTEELPGLFAAAGLRQSPGRIEVYPRVGQALRLPFGYTYAIPDTFDATDWVDFVRDWRAHRIPAYSVARLCEEVARIAAQREKSERIKGGWGGTRDKLADAAWVGKSRRTAMTPPRRLSSGEFDDLLQKQSWSKEDGERFETLTIPRAGVRTEAMKKLAWHLVFSRRLPEDEAAERLIDYAYVKGQHFSKDVGRDLELGARKVAKQARDLVARLIAKRGARPSVFDWRGFTGSEVRRVEEYLFRRSLPVGEVAQHAGFLLHALLFAKQFGEAGPAGWVVAIAVQRGMRKWPGCSQMRYLKYLDFFLSDPDGLLKVVRDRVFYSDVRKGQARTYAVAFPPSPTESEEYSLEDAVAKVVELRDEREAALARWEKEAQQRREEQDRRAVATGILLKIHRRTPTPTEVDAYVRNLYPQHYYGQAGAL